MGRPGSQTDLTTPARGQMRFPPDMEYRPEPLQSPPPHVLRATAAAGHPTGVEGNPPGSQSLQPPVRLLSHATAAAEDLHW